MQNNSMEYLMNAGNSTNTWVLVGGPMGVLVIVAALLFLIVKIRRAKETKDLEQEYSAPKTIDPLPKSENRVLDKVEKVSDVSEVDNDVVEIKNQTQDTWLSRLKSGLSRTRTVFSEGLGGIFLGSAKIDDSTLERIHEILYKADVGVATADRLVSGLRTKLAGQTVDWGVVKDSLLQQAGEIFSESERPLNAPELGLFVILVVGVNGVGKTTTIGKLAARFTAQGKKVMLCAADTFRAAAIEQLMVWGERNKVPVIKQQQGSDPAAVAFDGVQAAKARGMDVLIIDTAGRLHNKNDLMVELSKINKSIGKGFEGAPHETWIVVDATTGQNAVQQVKAFGEVAKLSGIVVTKLDGTAKGGVIIGIANQFKVPIRYIGVGEKAADLKEFNAIEFMRGLLDS